MANLQIAFGPNLVGAIALVGKDDSETIRGLSNVTVTLADSTNAYIADAANGQNTFYIVPRQNLTGGTPLTAPVTVSMTIGGKDPILGGTLPSITVACDLLVEPPPPPHSTHIEVQTQETLTLTTVPSDPGTLTITLT